MRNTNVVFPKGKVHSLSTRYAFWTLCGLYRRSTLLETLKEVTCLKCLKEKRLYGDRGFVAKLKGGLKWKR